MKTKFFIHALGKVETKNVSAHQKKEMGKEYASPVYIIIPQ